MVTRHVSLDPRFVRLGVALEAREADHCIFNPASARLRNGELQLYPRIVAPGNISRIGSFRAHHGRKGHVKFSYQGVALEPKTHYERGSLSIGYGCEDPRVTFVPALDRYLMAYVALGQNGPQVALAVSTDGLTWTRLGLLCFRDGAAPVADKDAAFFPEPVRSPSGVCSLAFYHRPTLRLSVTDGQSALSLLKSLPSDEREGIALGYVPLDEVKQDISRCCLVAESHRLEIPDASWGQIKVGAGTPPIRIREGWLSVIHGADALEHPSDGVCLRYSAGVIVHDADRVDRVVYRSPKPVVRPRESREVYGNVGCVVFPTAIDPVATDMRTFDVYYGMADAEIGRGRLTI